VLAAASYLFGDVFDLKPTSILIWLGSVGSMSHISDPTIQERRNTAALQDASENFGRGRADTFWSAAVLRRFLRRLRT
jgi:hypothetical protein